MSEVSGRKSFPQHPKLRSACDACHEAKVRCTGGSPCVHCKNHQQSCHYSYAARIGKPKGSRNRKTLARLREAAMIEESSSISGSSSSVNSDVSFYSGSQTPSPSTSSLSSEAFGPASTLSCYEWTTPADNVILSPQQDNCLHHGWVDLSCFASENAELSFNNLYIPHETITSEPVQAQRSSSVKAMAACTATDANIFGTVDDLSWLTTSTTVPAGNFTCDCYQAQASKLITLNSLRLSASTIEDKFVESHPQCVAAVFSSCQRTLQCPLCRTDPSLILFTVTSVQMAYSQLEDLLMQQVNSQYAPGSSLSRGLESGLLSLAQSVLNDLQHVVRESNISSMTAKASLFSHHLLDTNGPSDRHFLQQAIDRLQAKLRLFNSIVSLGFGERKSNVLDM